MNKDDLLKIKTSETKMEIIKQLSKGQRTPSDLSRILKKSKSTIVEHLESLIDFGLVIKIERPGKKWVFYSLTKNGYEIIHGRPRISQVILTGSLLSIICGFIVLLFSKTLFQQYTITESGLQAVKSPEATLITTPNTYFYISVIFFAIGILGILFHFYINKVRLWK